MNCDRSLELVTKRVLEILVFFVCKGGRKLISFFLSFKKLFKLMNTTIFPHEQERSQLNAI